MPETLSQLDANGSKEDKYKNLIPQIQSLIETETNFIANLANTSSALKETFGFWWVGFYLVDKNETELVLGPFQGPIACTRIKKGKGVCGASWAKLQTILVPDVDAFPGHIACSSASKSEIVVPLLVNADKSIGVLDVDSEFLNNFDSTDETYLNQICNLLIQNYLKYN